MEKQENIKTYPHESKGGTEQIGWWEFMQCLRFSFVIAL